MSSNRSCKESSDSSKTDDGIRRFFVVGSGQERPHARRAIYCDGSADSSFRPDVDIELSHWVPNRTPQPFKADTSTEICMRFVEQSHDESGDLAINNHLDVDGILAVYTVICGDQALRHRRTIVEAAEMGDFWGWGESPAQVLFQGLTILMDDLSDRGTDVLDVYQQCFDAIPLLLKGDSPLRLQIDDGLAYLKKSVDHIESGMIARVPYGSRFVHYSIPAQLAKGRLEQALHVPSFNERISSACLLWPQARARRDVQRVALVSVEADQGWYYDLWYPGYAWADTPNRWRAPGLEFSDSANDYLLNHEALSRVAAELRSLDTGDGDWSLVSDFAPFAADSSRPFPVVLSHLDRRMGPTPSKLPPDEVASRVAAAFE